MTTQLNIYIFTEEVGQCLAESELKCSVLCQINCNMQRCRVHRHKMLTAVESYNH